MAALSRAEKALESDSAVFDLFTCLAVFRMFSKTLRLTARLLVFCLAAFIADLVLGIKLVVSDSAFGMVAKKVN